MNENIHNLPVGLIKRTLISVKKFITKIWVPIIVTIITQFTVGIFFSHFQKTDDRIEDIEAAVRNVTYDEEALIKLCDNYKKNHNKLYYYKRLEDFNSQIKEQLGKLYTLMNHAHEHNLISKITYEELNSFAHDYNIIFENGYDACQFSHLNKTETRLKRERIVNIINSQ